MIATHPARAYQQNATYGASPVQLTVLLHDAALRSLHRAAQAVEAGDIERRTQALNHVLELTAELQSALDFTRGGEVAQNLNRFYELTRQQILAAGAQKSKPLIEGLIAQFSSLREAWAQVERASSISL
jgi:flagellar protein FliS